VVHSRALCSRNVAIVVAVLGLGAILVAACSFTYFRHGTRVAWLRVNETTVDEHGIYAVSMDDGIAMLVHRSGLPCITNLTSGTDKREYLYFDVIDDTLRSNQSVYVSVRYFDDRVSSPVELQYDINATSHRTAIVLSGGACNGAHRWQTATFRIDRPVFEVGATVGADMRILGRCLYINSVSVSADMQKAQAALELSGSSP